MSHILQPCSWHTHRSPDWPLTGVRALWDVPEQNHEGYLHFRAHSLCLVIGTWRKEKVMVMLVAAPDPGLHHR